MKTGLVYVSDSDPGIRRVKRGKNFRYLDPSGAAIACEQQLARIQALAVPPAYRNVWICTKENGHIQATGFDAAGRKQYRYHSDWTDFRSEAKFDRLPEFGRKLPRIRRRVEAILSGVKRDQVFTKEVATAALVRLIDHNAMRIGGRSKDSQGATTLAMRNIDFGNGSLKLRYTAKGGKRAQSTVNDRRLQRILEKIGDLPGRKLFQYIGGDGEVHPLDSGDVNGWLKIAADMEDISAKMFRTWHGSVAALEALRKADRPTVKVACEAAADVLCNTPAISRKSYVHPAVLELAGTDDIKTALRKKPESKIRGLDASERRLMSLVA